MPNISDMVYV